MPLLILTGGESESVSLILLISLSQFWIDFTISFNSKQLVLFNSVFKGVIVFKDSLRLNNSLGLIFFVDIFETSLSRSLNEFNISIIYSLTQ